MRFVDSNIFLHAYLKPKRALNRSEKIVKQRAVEILSKIRNGEQTVTSVCHLSEVLNILESGLGRPDSLGFLAWAMTADKFRVLEVSREDYESSLPVASDYSVSANDALAYVLMEREGLNEIYSFDHHFDQFKNIKRLHV